MKSFNLIAVFVVAICTSLFFAHENSGADDLPKKVNGFSSPYIVVTTTSGGGCLESPEIRILGGRSFIVGKAAPAKNPWKPVAGHLMWIAMDTVSQIIEFESVDEIQDVISSESSQESKAPEPPKSLN